MQNQQGMTAPPPVISTKDHLYLQDMLNWNLLAMKKSSFYGGTVSGSVAKSRA